MGRTRKFALHPPLDTSFLTQEGELKSIGVRKARFRASLPSEPDRRVSRIRLSSRWFAAERSDERLAGAVWRAPFQRSELTLPSPQLRGVITMNLD